MALLQVETRDLEDASDEIALAGDDEGAIKYLVGDSYCDENEDAVTTLIEKQLEVCQARIAVYYDGSFILILMIQLTIFSYVRKSRENSII